VAVTWSSGCPVRTACRYIVFSAWATCVLGALVSGTSRTSG
jgi:hypothetical protein